jgi:hypothetical protein
MTVWLPLSVPIFIAVHVLRIINETFRLFTENPRSGKLVWQRRADSGIILLTADKAVSSSANR